ncbi:uncharacterized protein LOC134653041 [Cydia amplana]|uniref:uncharacterized protein LOC134653041 n=1 Tax=Cydia amplana TaxID=1869771 RepID=UPI002FE51BC0
MIVFKCILPFLIVCLVQGVYCKPTSNELTEGRGVGSTIWGWITYPFTGWWGSSDTGAPPQADLLNGSTTIGPYDNVEIASRNLTIWCNDHTCTTMKCDKTACVNVTCNIYDTYVTGQCREYNMGLKPEEPKPSLPTEPAPTSTSDAVVAAPESSTAPTVPIQTVEPAEHPLELEVALSSTVTKGNPDVPPPKEKVDKSSSQNKV